MRAIRTIIHYPLSIIYYLKEQHKNHYLSNLYAFLLAFRKSKKNRRENVFLDLAEIDVEKTSFKFRGVNALTSLKEKMQRLQ